MTASHADQFTIEGLTSRAQITELVHLYAHCIDRRRWDLLAHVFHDDATWWVSSIGHDSPWQQAVSESRELFDRALGVTHHQVGNVLITLDGDCAHSETLCTAYHRVLADAPLGGMFGGTGSEYDLIAGGRYLDRWERRDGGWKIAQRRVHSGWRHQQSAADGILASVPAEGRGRFDDTDRSTPVIERFRRLTATTPKG